MNKFIAVILLILLLPFLLFMVLLLLFQKGKGVFFVQERFGKDKELIQIFKFRSMSNNKVTFIGRLIRKTGIDELPQLVNIIKGDMNFVGPRPLTNFDVQRLNWDNKETEKRWNIHPGLSGLAQLQNICDADLSLQNDLYYIDNKSIKLDAKILWKSAIIPFVGKPKQIKK